MTDIEKKALALLIEVREERGGGYDGDLFDREIYPHEALCRAIEQHEAFRQEVSDAVEVHMSWLPKEVANRSTLLDRFIIPKPVDPLLEAVGDAMQAHEVYSKYELTDSIRAIGKARGYEWRKIEGEGR